MRRLIIEADGGSRGNPGPAGYGALVRDASTGEVLATESEYLGVVTNNVAEYSGLIAGLRLAARIDPHASVLVRMDSRLVVEQMSGRWKIKHPDMKPLALRAGETARGIAEVSYEWVPRERNKDADRLANEAMDAGEQGSGGRRSEGRARPAEVPPPPSPDPPAADRQTRGADTSRSPRGAATGWGPAQGQATITLLLRHGQTALSTERRFAGLSDIELTETGVRQAKLAGERLAARGGVDVIVASPLRRTRQTAEEVASATSAPVEYDDDLRETDFGLAGRPGRGALRRRELRRGRRPRPGGPGTAHGRARPGDRPGRQPCDADQDAAHRGAARAARGHVPDAPGRRVAERDRLVQRRSGGR
jgi:probable phosphoglycerate mutase